MHEARPSRSRTAREGSLSDGPEKIDPGASAEPCPAEEQPPAEGPAQEPSSAERAGPAEAAAAVVEPASTEPAAKAPAAAEPAPAAAERRKSRFPALVRAHRAGRAVEGKIAQVIKGGYEVRLGRARAFCPHSQVDLHREDEPERQVGKSYLFRITQLRRGGEDIVVSRRAGTRRGAGRRGQGRAGDADRGCGDAGARGGRRPVRSVHRPRCRVLGLAHISELSHQRVQTVEDAVKIGDTVNVRILKLKESGRISLSIRPRAEPRGRPRQAIRGGQGLPGDHSAPGRLRGLRRAGPGDRGARPGQRVPARGRGLEAGLEVGQELQWYVLSVDVKARRVSVTLPGEPAAGDVTLAEGAELTGQVQRIERYGVFVWLGPGRVGLMPRAMTGASEGADLRREFRIGDPVEVSVVQIEEGGRRIRLCKKGIDPAPEPEAAPPPAKTRPEPAEEPETSAPAWPKSSAPPWDRPTRDPDSSHACEPRPGLGRAHAGRPLLSGCVEPAHLGARVDRTRPTGLRRGLGHDEGAPPNHCWTSFPLRWSGSSP